jgi:hypothetical protein
LYFTGVGWVRFEPTPSRGFEPNFPSAPSLGTTTLPTAGTTGVATPVPTSTSVTAPRLPDQGANAPRSAAQTSTALPASSYGALGLVGVLLLLAAPAIIRITVRRRRVERIRQGIDPAGWSWQELRESARDLGVDARESSTPTELATQLAAYLALAPNRTAKATAALARLRDLVVDEVYGVPAYRYNGEDMADELRTVLQGLRRATSPLNLLAATVVPPTLVDRVLGRATARA